MERVQYTPMSFSIQNTLHILARYYVSLFSSFIALWIQVGNGPILVKS